MYQKLLLIFLVSHLPWSLQAQWTNQYPQVDGFNHHIYLEGFELPVMNAGPTDPAPSPTGKELAFAARGWLWLMDIETGHARRITHSKDMDSRPEWSPDGTSLVFLRDTGSALDIVWIDLSDTSRDLGGASRESDASAEKVLVSLDVITLDPVYSPDGRWVYYASAEDGQLHLWRVSVDSLEREQLTAADELQTRPLKRRPIILDPDRLVYLDKQGSADSIRILDTRTGVSTPLLEDRIAAQADMALSPDGRYLAYTWPFDGGYELRLMAVTTPDTSVLLTRSRGMPLMPAFSHDGQAIYFAEANDDERTELKRISVHGGPVEDVAVNDLDWGVPMGRLSVQTRIGGEPVATRIHAVDAAGHPVIPATGAVRFEGQNDRIFFYSDGEIELLAPAGLVTIAAVQGFETPEVTREVIVRADTTTSVVLDLERVWDASASGWYSGDNHFHLNYGGIYRLDPRDILPDLRGEGIDMAFPLLANLHNRFLQQDLWGWSYTDGPIIQVGQEVRSHFLGHVGLIGTDELFWPWIWGPGYQLYAEDDRTNAAVLRHARTHNGLGGYVHLVSSQDPFTADTAAEVPIAFVADAVLGEIDLIELACLWSDEVGTGALWHNVLNLGIPLAASAGSDVMNDYYRTMAIGATRVYVKPQGDFATASYLQALKAGRSFVSTGPMLEFTVEGVEPGGAVAPDAGSADWALEVHSALPFDRVEIFINGQVVQTLEGNPRPGSKAWRGSVDVPAGGWITARVLGVNSGWPAMNSYLFAESSPVWFGQVGSTDPAALRQSARNLLMLLEVAEQNMREGYEDAPIPQLLEHFDRARQRLESLAGPEPAAAR